MTSRIVGNSALLALDLELRKIVSIDIPSGSISDNIAISLSDLETLWQQAPDTIPDYYIVGTERGSKMSYSEALRYLRRDNSGITIDGFDVYNNDSIFATATIRFPYSEIRENGDRYVGHLMFAYAIKTRYRSDSIAAILLSPQKAANFCPVSFGVNVQGSKVWLSAWDWKQRTEDAMLNENYWWARSARYTRSGEFTGKVSREKSNYNDSGSYRQTSTWLADGLDTTTYVRVMSAVSAVDIVNADDGSFVRVDLPSSVMSNMESVFTTHPVRFGVDLLAVVLRKTPPDKGSQQQFVVIGKLAKQPPVVQWIGFYSCTSDNQLLSLVDTNDSPLYRKDLLGIFENPDTGPYLARIELE
ncbi:MAG: hypothetical protein FGM32_09610 [Candidatus Kapabacteria bacterium]|nr:hypothetical protein [Candidatus Kapabacteria bacterium]